jgi:hypothetical protein
MCQFKLTINQAMSLWLGHLAYTVASGYPFKTKSDNGPKWLGLNVELPIWERGRNWGHIPCVGYKY